MTFPGKIICILAAFMVVSFVANLIGPLAFALGIIGLIGIIFLAGAFTLAARADQAEQQALDKHTNTERDRLITESEIQFGTATTTHHTARGGSRFLPHGRSD